MARHASTESKPSPNTGAPQKIPVVGIGASAGGLNAFKAFFGKMPPDTGMAFVLIPHLDPDHKSLMVEIIGRHTDMPAVQVEGPMEIMPNHIYTVPPNRNLAIEEGRLVLHEISRRRGINLPVDFFFRSLAVAQNERAIGVILSGTMSDGTMGLKEIKEHGGLVIAQAPETAQHDGMPRSAINTGMVDLVLPVEEMPDAIVKFIAHPYIHGDTQVKDEDELNQVLAVIHARSNHDFRCYKRNTLIRRTERRMGLRQIEKMTDYVDILKNDTGEADALQKDLLIGVTGFFREEEVWEKVGTEILPALLKKTDPDAPLRIWIPGCSTGEEAYTMAILAHDAFKRLNRRYSAQIFATDIDGDAIVAARSGVYPESVAANVSTEHLDTYFVHEDLGYRVLRKIRESVVFAVQNLLGDAPFSNLDIISCRNLLIYLEPEVQKKVIELFHFALREGGSLILGSSETVGYHHDLFETVSKECRIYRAIGRKDERMQIPILAGTGPNRGAPFGERPEAPRKNLPQLMQNQLLKRFAPPSVLINKKSEIVNLYGPTEDFLRMPQGDPVMDFTAMVREGLRIKMRAAVHKAVKKAETVTVSGARVKRDGRFHPVRFTVGPVREKDLHEALFIITFEEQPSSTPDAAPQADLSDGEETLVKQLEAELMTTREDLQNTIEELETSNEELKASNEEMMSMNEELQSANEELETSKEELQSMNEELNTVNAELRDKIEEVESANNDLVNLMDSTEVATVFLDLETTIRRFTPSARKLFNLIPSDVGRPIGDLSRRFSDDDLADHTRRVMETLAPMTKQVKTDAGRWFIRRILPFRTQDNRVDGLVLTFSDVTEMKAVEAQLGISERKFRNLAENLPGMALKYKLNPDGGDELLYISKGVEDLFEVSREDAVNNNSLLWDRIHGDDLEEYIASLKTSAENLSFWEQEHRIQLPDGRVKWTHSLGVPAKQEDGGVVWDTLALDITGRKKAEEALRETHAFLQQVIDNSLALIVAKNRKGEYILANDISARLLGCQKDEMIGKTDSDLFPKETADRLAEDDGKVFETGEPLNTEEQIQIGDRERTFMTTKFPLFDANGGVYAICGMATDITERIELERALKESEERSRAIFEQAAAGIATATAKGRFLETNQALRDMLGYTDEELSEMTVYDITFPDDRERQMEKDKPVLEGQENTVSLEKRFVHKDGHPVWAKLSSRVIRDEDGKIQYVIGVLVDINEQKRAEAELQKSNALLEATGRMARVGGWELDPATSGVSWTEETCRIHEVPMDQKPPLEDALDFYPPEAREPLTRAIQRAMDGGEPYDLEIPFITAKGKPRWVRTICQPMVADGKTVKLSGTFQDITKRKNAEIALKKALAEKESLLREIHHRVKNNMQVITGLLRMHARRTDDGQLKQIFNDCRDRITAMSLIHESLYQSDDLARIDFGAYLKKLCRNLGQAYDLRGKGVTLDIDVDTVSLNMDQGIALGLVVSELISNAFKHAFFGDESGRVAIDVNTIEDGGVELTVSDDGAGLPAGFDIRKTSSLGLRLVEATVTRELGGTIDAESDNGARFIIRFKCEPRK